MASTQQPQSQLEPQPQPQTQELQTETPPQPETQSRVSSQRKGQELEKFKRRMIRSVARRLREKKKEDDIWEEMKKEIGSNCKKLWERMRMLTLKKLKRLLEADDRVYNIGPVARMTLTDWLLFDLVIVHEKIDVIDREKLAGNYKSKVLWNLFSLVQRFEIEGRVGENLAEAWTAATVYYNSKGHQCSPMMLQRRWFQIKELTRHKFYKFWFNYRGNAKQLIQAKMDSPDDLQRAIALKYPQVITQPFPGWEERIQNRLVILPEELGVKMRQTKLMKPSDVNAPDVVLIEPHIEVIDLGDDSDSDENDTIEISATQPPPLARIKSEPVDVDDHFEIEEAVYMPQEKGSEFEAEIERLQMVEEKISDVDDERQENNKIDGGTEFGDSNKTTISADPIEHNNNDKMILFSDTEANNQCNDKNGDIQVNEEVSETVTESNETTGLIIGHGNDTSKKTVDEDAVLIHDDDDESESTHQNTTAKEDDEQTNNTVSCITNIITESKSDTAEAVELTVEIMEANSSAVSTSIEKNVNDSLQIQTDNMDQDQVMMEEHLPVISVVSSAGVKVESILPYCDDYVDNDVLISNETAMMTNVCTDLAQTEVPEMLPVISTVSSAGIKVEIETTSLEFELELQNVDEPLNEIEKEPVVDDVIPIEDDIINLEPLQAKGDVKEYVSEKVNDIIEFLDIPKDLNFVDDGIEFADDGIEYVEDEDDIITVTEPPPTTIKTENEDQLLQEEKVRVREEESEGSQTSDEESKTESQKFDLKLLMYPVVYTTKLEAMSLFDDDSRYEQVFDKESIDKILTLSKPVSKQAINNIEQLELEHIKNDVNSTENNVVENNVIENECDDDLFQNESDSETEIIDDSIKVKLSSYMLQKPKNRTYNPISLCKNPDFNTRLKRLTVGFFMSARNRTLLQSCKPMTVDMSKAFESKLINGTMYLKPTPGDAVINIPDDTEVTSADLIKPSAVQQSLMNIDDTLENELRKRMTERNRAINLPDISEVRRLNQHLKTAEVTPLRLNRINPPDVNNQISVPIEKANYPTNYVENIKNDIDKLLSQQKPNVANTEIIIDSIPSSISMQKQQVQPTVTPSLEVPHAPQVTNNVMQNVPHSNTQVLVENTTRLLNNTSHKNIAAEPHIVSTKYTNKPEKVRKTMKKTYYPRLPWNKPDVTPSSDDSLLTIDTLYKMLSALDPCIDEKVTCKNKKKTKTNIPNTDNAKTNEDEQKVEKQKEANDKTNGDSKVKDVRDSVIDITVDDFNKSVKTKMKPKMTRRVVQDYCCWCRYKIDFLYGRVAVRRRHKCLPYNCKCCCINLFLQDMQCKNSNEVAVRNLRGQLEIQYSRVSETIENVVNEVSNEVTSIHVEGKNDTPIEMNPQTEIINPSIEITIEPQSNDNSEVGLSPTKSQPNSLFLSRTQRKRADTSDCTVTYKKRRPGRPPKMSFNLTDTPVQHPCTCCPKIVLVDRGKIEINGCGNCLRHKKIVKESKIYLNKKHIADNDQPFFVGKGKILLTNMKMPKSNTLVKTTLSDQAGPSIHEVPPCLPSDGIAPLTSYPQNIDILPSTITLPAGVQIIMLPDQTLSYFVQPDASLTPEEYTRLTNFLLAIQHQVNAVGVTLPVDNPVANISEVIDLENDESPEANNLQSISSSQSNIESNIDTTVNKDVSFKPFPLKSSNDESSQTKNNDKQTDSEHNTSKSDPMIENKGTATSAAVEKHCVDNAVPKDFKANNKPVADCKVSLPDDDKMRVSEHSTEENIVPVGENVIPAAHDKNKQDFKETESSNAGETSNKTNLLSDLMEMSGIFEEDIALPAQKNLPEEPIATSSAIHDPVPSTAVSDMIPQIVLPVSNLSPIEQKRNEFELSAVTSFAELKYACDNNGLFFKLDLETGEMTSINVCIQKFSSGASKTNVDTDKPVIDLTDDPDICVTGSTEDEAAKSSKRSTSTFLNHSEISSILVKKQRLMERLSNNLKPVNILQSKKYVARILKRNRSLVRDPSFSFYSKRKLDKIEAQIDLVDSDDQLENEDNGSSSDSDNEPLIKKAKRMRDTEATASSNQSEDNLNEQPNSEINESVEQENDHEMTEQESNERNLDDHEQSQDGEQDYMGEEEYLEDLDDLIPTNVIQPESMPVPTNLVLSGNALNAHNIPLNPSLNADGDDESSQDDCILGV